MNTYQVRVYWSDESSGDLDSCFDVKAKDYESAWDKAFNEYFTDPIKAKQAGEFIGEHFIYDMFYDPYTNSYRFKDEIDIDQLKVNEDGEIENVRTYTMEIRTDEDENEWT